MQLSVCLLASDGDDDVEGAVRSVAGLGAEVIVGACGGDHGARAEALGARVVRLAWHDDMAAAQNEILAAASGDWVFWLNPHEELLPAGRAELGPLLARHEVLAYLVRVQEMMCSDRPELCREVAYPRLFRQRDDVRFVGRIGPHFELPLAALAQREGMQIDACDLQLRYHAYRAPMTEVKLRQSVRLLELELRDRPGQLPYLIEYGRDLLRLDDIRGHQILAEAAPQVLAVQDAPVAPVGEVAALLEYALTAAPKGPLTAALAGKLALRWFPQSPPLLWALAQRAFEGGDYEEAAWHLETIVDVARDGNYDTAAAFDPALLGEPTLLNLGKCYLCLGLLDRAESAFFPLLSSPQHRADARRCYALVQQQRRESGR